MNLRKILLTTTIVLIAGLSVHVHAQFEGKIEMKLYTEDEGKKEVNTFNMFVTDNRILIQGEETFSLGEGMNAEGLLIRNDHSDFVLMMGEDKAIHVTKSEIEGLIDMFSAMSGQSQAPPADVEEGPLYRFSEEKRTIMGKECVEMIVEDEENPDNYLSIWLTPKVEINWGMLAEPWKNIPEGMESEIHSASQEVFFKGKNFPMLIEAHEGEKTTKLFEVITMNESSVAKAMVEIPSGITLISARDYIFNMMMQQK